MLQRASGSVSVGLAVPEGERVPARSRVERADRGPRVPPRLGAAHRTGEHESRQPRQRDPPARTPWTVRSCLRAANLRTPGQLRRPRVARRLRRGVNRRPQEPAGPPFTMGPGYRSCPSLYPPVTARPPPPRQGGPRCASGAGTLPARTRRPEVFRWTSSSCSCPWVSDSVSAPSPCSGWRGRASSRRRSRRRRADPRGLREDLDGDQAARAGAALAHAGLERRGSRRGGPPATGAPGSASRRRPPGDLSPSSAAT